MLKGKGLLFCAVLLTSACAHDTASDTKCTKEVGAKCGPIFKPQPLPLPVPLPSPEPLPVPQQEPKKETVVVHFKFDSSKLEETEKALIKNVFLHLKANNPISIVGHTDSQGSNEYNEKLSKKRAEVVAKYLMKEFKIPKDLISISWKGEMELLNLDKSIDEHRQNRRSVVILEVR